MNAAAQPVAGAEANLAATQFLTFVLDDEEFGVEILQVQEIKGYTAISPIPNAPPHVKGLMNLRGTVVPVVDLRCRFGMPPREYTKFTVVIVVRVCERVVGMLVDGVSEVLDVAPANLGPPPALGAGVDTSFLSAVARNGERLITILDIERTLGFADGAA